VCWKCNVHKRAGFTQLLKRVVKEYCLLDVLMGLGKGGREGGGMIGYAVGWDVLRFTY